MTLVAIGLIRAPTVVGASRLRVNYHFICAELFEDEREWSQRPVTFT